MGFSEESRKKMSKTRKRLIREGKVKAFGYGYNPRQFFSELTRKKMSETHKLLYKSGKYKELDERRIHALRISNLGRKDSQERITKQIAGLIRVRGHPQTNQGIEKIKLARAKQLLPIKDSSIEVKIQGFLKQLGIEYFTHQYIKEIEHGYQCDIFVPSMNLVIECDGNYWHKYPVGNEIDHIRTKELIKKGFKVLRLWETEIKKMNLEIFIEIIKKIDVPIIVLQNQ